jgi:transcriptional regulator with XRE-family HTH domain
MATKVPDLVDKHVGSRVRMRRLMLAMSQQKLGGELGITFQQVQKYENGTNRISSRLRLRLTEADGLKLVRAFMQISDAKLRRSLVRLVEEIVGEGDR